MLKLKQFLLQILFIILSCSNLLASENFTTISLNLKHKALYITYCDINNDGLLDIIAADKHNITIFEQKENLCYIANTINSEEKIEALNSIQFGKGQKSGIVCLGENDVWYFFYNTNGDIEGPKHIELSKDNKAAFLKKQKNIKNFSFIVDLNNDNLDDIIIPIDDGLLLLWQTEPMVFAPYLLSLQNKYENASMNIRYWPKSDKKINGYTKGVSFFPRITKSLTYWFQDYNNDSFLDLFVQKGTSESIAITIYLQKQDFSFQESDTILLKNNGDLNRNICDLRFLDLNNDNALDLIKTEIRHPLEDNLSLLPLMVIKIYFNNKTPTYNRNPDCLYKTVFIPGLDNIVDLNSDGKYEIITSSSPIRIGDKEALIKIATNKKIDFHINYTVIDKQNSQRNKTVAFKKPFTVTFSNINNIDKINGTLQFIDLNNDGIRDIFTQKNNTSIEISLLKQKKDRLVVEKELYAYNPFTIAEVISVDMNLDNYNDFLLLDSSRKKINVIYLQKL